MRGLLMLATAILFLGACADKDNRVLFNGNYYPTKAKKVKGDRQSFVVSVRKAAQGIDGAREAGRHGGIRYCVETFGYSEIDWEIGPESDQALLSSDKGRLTMKGRCKVWE